MGEPVEFVSRSGRIRSDIALILTRGTTQLAAATAETPFEIDQNNSVQENLLGVELKYVVWSKHWTKLKATLTRLEDQLTKWEKLMSELELDEMPEEERVFSNYNDRTHLVESHNQLEDAVTAAEENMKILEIRKRHLQARSNRPQVVADRDRPVDDIRLPKLEIHKFGGRPTEWSQFWEHFESSIHNNERLSDIAKLKYLVSFLEKEAAKVVKGYRIVAQNYPIIVDLLKERYGKDKVVAESLIREVNTLRSPGENVKHMRNFAIEVERLQREIKENNVGMGDRQFIYCIKSKLPIVLLERMVDPMTDWDDMSAEDFSLLLTKTVNCVREIYWRKTEKEEKTKEKTFVTQAVEEPKKNQGRTCLFCDKAHKPWQCTEFKNAEQKKNRLKEMGRCFRCLKDYQKTHVDTNECEAKCAKCEGKHHRLICPKTQKDGKSKEKKPVKNKANAVNSHPEPEDEEEGYTSEGSFESKSFFNKKSHSMLPTVRVTLFNPKTKKETEIYALLDSGSEATYITKICSNTLGIDNGIPTNLLTEVFGTDAVQKQSALSVQIGIKLLNQKRTIKVLAVEKLVGTLNIVTKSGRKIHNKIVEPQMLIGSDYLMDFLEFKGKPISEKFAEFETNLGNIIMPKTAPPLEYVGKAYANKLVGIENSDPVTNLWRLDLIGIKPDNSETIDEQVHKDFLDSIKFENKRYSVKWLWNGKEKTLPTNLAIAFFRLKSSMNSLKKNTELLKDYRAQFEKQNTQGIIEMVKEPNNSNSIISYLPHQAVITPQKTTTKLRIVFDASAKSKNGLSVNDTMYSGPLLLPQLVGLLIRSRIGRYLCVSDIEKAFLQINLFQSERDVTRFLLPKDWDKPIDYNNLQVWRYQRLGFGIICSPSILAMTLKHHLDKYGDMKEIVDNLYVDNLIQTNDEIKSLEKEAKTIQNCFSEASFNLREFFVNDEKLLKKLNPDNSESSTKVLGIKWNFKTDEISLTWNEWEDKPITKRSILAYVAGIYDPLGLISPALIPLKLLIQELWLQKKDWDDELDEAFQKKAANLLNQWKGISEKTIKRLVSSKKTILQLHVFVDASINAYGAAAYVKVDSDINLIFAKARVVPVDKKKTQTLTIPRKELLALLCGVRIAKYLQTEMKNLGKIVVWSDSQVCLHQIQTPKDTTVFVKNRIKEISESRNSIEFRYVPTEENPADLCSRGKDISSLSKEELWWTGPNFLKEEENNWPRDMIIPIEPLGIPEEEIIILTIKRFDPIINISKVNSYKKLITIVKMIFKFVNRCKKSTEITTLNQIENLLWRPEQSTSPPSEKTKKKYLLFQDDAGLWRIGTRLQAAEIPTETKYPIWLPPDSLLTEKLILHFHEKNLHQGGNAVTVALRERYWISLRKVRSVVKKCVKCKIHNSKPFPMPTFAPLPETRVIKGKPFSAVGIDILGPLRAIDGPVYILLFTCLKIRAVHLEVIDSLKTEIVFGAMQKFMARRGSPDIWLSDNALYFVLSKKLLILQSENQNIEWIFISPEAPWQGGIYERLNKNIKEALRRTFGRAKRSFREFDLLITLIEGTLNNRPLTTVTDNPEDHRVLRPVDFLRPESNDYTESGISININDLLDPEYLPQETRMSEVRNLISRTHDRLNVFWQRWSSEYLLTLMDRNPNRKLEQKNPKIGELVLIEEEERPRGEWKLGRISKLIPSKDGIIRNAEILIPSRKILKRAINCLYPLEIGGEIEAEELVVKKQPPPVSPRRSGRQRKVKEILTFVASLISLFVLASGQSPIYCHDKAPKTLWKVPDIPNCREDWIRPQNLCIRRIKLYRPNHVEYKSAGYSCKIKSSTVEQLTEINGHEIIEEKENPPESVSADECRDWVKHRKCAYGGLVKGNHISQTENIVEIKPPNRIVSFFSSSKAIKRNCFLQETNVFAHHGSTSATSALADLSSCAYQSNFCHPAKNHVIVWNASQTQLCEFIPYGEVKAMVSHNIAILDELQLMVTFNKKDMIKDCKTKLYKTPQGLALEFLDDPPPDPPKSGIRKFNSNEGIATVPLLPTPQPLIKPLIKSKSTNKQTPGLVKLIKSTTRTPIETILTTKKKVTPTNPTVRKVTKSNVALRRTRFPAYRPFLKKQTTSKPKIPTPIPVWRITHAWGPPEGKKELSGPTNDYFRIVNKTNSQQSQQRYWDQTNPQNFAFRILDRIPEEKFRRLNLSKNDLLNGPFDSSTLQKLEILKKELLAEMRGKRQINVADSETAELQYAEHKFNELTRKAIHTLCSVINEQNNYYKNAMQINPTRFMRVLLKRDNVKALSLTNNVIELNFCHQFNQSDIKFIPNVKNCSIPILIKSLNTILYLERKTGELFRNWWHIEEEENCNELIHIVLGKKLFLLNRNSGELSETHENIGKTEDKTQKQDWGFIENEVVFKNTLVRETLATSMQEELLREFEIASESATEEIVTDQTQTIPTHLVEELMDSWLYYYGKVAWVIWVSACCFGISMYVIRTVVALTKAREIKEPERQNFFAKIRDRVSRKPQTKTEDAPKPSIRYEKKGKKAETIELLTSPSTSGLTKTRSSSTSGIYALKSEL